MPLAFLSGVGLSTAKVLVFAIIFSVIFGFLHGGIPNIFIQGVGGFMYSVLFLKCGGLQGNYTKAIATSTAVHFLFNMTLLAIAIISGGTSF